MGARSPAFVHPPREIGVQPSRKGTGDAMNAEDPCQARQGSWFVAESLPADNIREVQHMKFHVVLLLILAGLAFLAGVGCSDDGGGGASPTASAAFPLTFTDDAQNGITLATEPERIVALAPSFVEVDRKSTRLNSSHLKLSRMPSSA